MDFLYRFLFLLFSFLMMAAPSGAVVKQRAFGERTEIQFPEPLVPLSATTQTEEKQRSAAPVRFRISGDEKHLPTAEWSDQDTLSFVFPRGSSSQTEYVIEFEEGTTYLSGKPMPERRFTFRCAEPSYYGQAVTDARGPAVLLSARSALTREARELCPETAPRFVFRECKYRRFSGKRYLGRSVEAVPEPAPARYGMGNAARSMAIELTAEQRSKLAEANQVAGQVLLRPAEPLPPGSTWVLVRIGDSESAKSYAELSPTEDLPTAVTQELLPSGKIQVTIAFGDAVPAEELPEIFAEMGISCGEARASAPDAQQCRTLNSGGRSLRLRYIGPAPMETVEFSEGGSSFSYAREGVSNALFMEMEGDITAPVDITLPKGLHTALGFATACEHIHRLIPGAVEPSLSYPEDGKVLRLPYHGSHRLSVPTKRYAQAEARLYRIPRERAVQVYQRWHQQNLTSLNELAECATNAVYMQRLMHQRKRAGLEVFEGYDEQAAESVRQWSQANEKREELTAKGSMEAPVLFSSAEGRFDIDLDALTGGNTTPGLYVLSMVGCPEQSLREQLESSRLDGDLLRTERLLLIQVSDMLPQVAQGDRTCALLVTNLNNGQPVSVADYTLADGTRGKVQNGAALWKRNEKKGNITVLIEKGDDFTLATPRSSFRTDRATDEAQQKTLIITDRSVYRPGETVHAELICRCCLPDGSSALPSEKKVRVSVVKPHSGEEVLSKDLELSACGTAVLEFALPEGEEDVAGIYELVAELGKQRQEHHISCQVFRRNAFLPKAELEMDAVAPQRAKIHISAEDYNGMPVQGAQVKLTMSYNFLSDDEEPADVTLSGTTDAAGQWSGEMPVCVPEHAVGSVTFSGSVANDREEYVTLNLPEKFVAAGELMVEVDENRLVRVRRVVDKKPVAGEVTLNVYDVSREYIPIGGGFNRAASEASRRLVSSRSMSVGENGVPVGDLLNRKDRPKGNQLYELSVRDSEGREVRCRLYPWLLYRDSEAGYMELSEENGDLQVQVSAPAAGTAHIFISDGIDCRHLTRELKPGLQKLEIPLKAQENGELCVTLMMPLKDEQGLMCGRFNLSESVSVRRRDNQLDVALELPANPQRPGAVMTWSGSVSFTEAGERKPVRDAEVLLFAVDEGMLSVAPYEMTDPATAFNLKEGEPLWLPFPLRWTSSRETLLSLLWNGELISRGTEMKGTVRPLFRCAPTVARMKNRATAAPVPMPCVADAAAAGASEESHSFASDDAGAEMPRLRTNFVPLALWKAGVLTDAAGRFRVETTLPDTLTTYRVYAVAVERSGRLSGLTEGKVTVNQELMLTPGIPLMMSTGDRVQLPLTVSNNSEEQGTWSIRFSGAESEQTVTLAPKETKTLSFEYTAETEGAQKFTWTAVGEEAGDAVQAELEVRFPAPLLKEVHHLTLVAGEAAQTVAALMAPELAQSARGSIAISASANPLILASGSLDFLVSASCCGMEQSASGLLPWLYYEQLSPFCPEMARKGADEARLLVQRSIAKIFARQRKDGGLSYWGKDAPSCPWVSAYAAAVLQIASERGYALPERKMKALLHYVRCIKDPSPETEYYIARATREEGRMRRAVSRALRETEPERLFFGTPERENWQLLEILSDPKQDADAAFTKWLSSTARDVRHRSVMSHGRMMFVIAEYLKGKRNTDSVTLVVNGGEKMSLDQGRTNIDAAVAVGSPLGSTPRTLQAVEGTVYAVVRVCAYPEQREFPGVTEKGLQITRQYERLGSDGQWQQSDGSAWQVGDVIRVTLTAAKVADELSYLVLEDYLPSCMEAINPDVPSQAAGLEPLPWSLAFDEREFLADRVRGFCTKWGGRDLLNMRYYARVKRAGSCTAPPAQAQLLYEPQIYGLSPNTQVTVKP